MHHGETVWQNTKWWEEERKKYKVSKEKYTKQITWSVVEFKIMHVAICAPGLKCVQVCYVSRSDWLTLYCHTPSLAHQANNESIVSRILSILHRSIVWRRELKMYIFPIVFFCRLLYDFIVDVLFDLLDDFLCFCRVCVCLALGKLFIFSYLHR